MRILYACPMEINPPICGACNCFDSELERCAGTKDWIDVDRNTKPADCPIQEVVSKKEYETITKQLEQYKIDYTRMYKEKELLDGK